MTTTTLIKEMTQFSSLEAAKNYVNRAEKINMILMGDNGKYWVGLPKHTEKLNKQGYEYIK